MDIQKKRIVCSLISFFFLSLTVSSCGIPSGDRSSGTRSEGNPSGEKVTAAKSTDSSREIGSTPASAPEPLKALSSQNGDEIQGGEFLMVADFEAGTPKNNLGGESGTWSVDPDNENAVCREEIVTTEGVRGPTKALKLRYRVDSGSEFPVKNGYWTKLRNLDGYGYDHLEFYVKGDPAENFSSSFRVELKRFKDQDKVEKLQGGYVVRNVTPDWQKVSIPLNAMTGLLNFENPEMWKDTALGRKDLDELVIVFEERRADQKKGVIYLDDIRFVKTGHPGPTAIDYPPRSKGDKTPVRLEGLPYMKFLVKRLQGFPKTNVLKKNFPEDSKGFLTEVARDTWRYFDEIVDREHQLPPDNIYMGKEEPLDEGGYIMDYTNVTNVGLYLMCLVAAEDFAFITREDAVKRIRMTLATLKRLDSQKDSGFLYNYYDTTQLESTSYFVSFVDSGWLAAGLYVAKGAYPELSKECDEFLSLWNFSFFYDPVDQQMFHGYYDQLKVYSDYHYSTFFTEPRVISAMAIARGDVPEEHWFRMVRTFPEEFSWQSEVPSQRFVKETMGYRYYGGYYEWKDLRYVPSWGGSMFEALMPTLVLDEKNLAKEGLGMNDEVHVRGHIRYAKEELGYPVWGMSPCAIPEGGYSEYGVRPFGSKGYKDGVVTPHASFLSLEFAPEEAVMNLRKLLASYDIYGEYGFYDSVNVATGLVAKKYLCLDQAMSFLSLCNYLKNGTIRKHFYANEIFTKIAPLLAEEKFFDVSQRPQDDRDVIMKDA